MSQKRVPNVAEIWTSYASRQIHPFRQDGAAGAVGIGKEVGDARADSVSAARK